MIGRWTALFSQTGSELLQVCRGIDRFPDLIITTNYDTVSPGLLEEIRNRKIPFLITPKPSKQDYISILRDSTLVTLHGWLYIIPPTVCYQYAIYNGHPGLITKYPELKGRDPQLKAHLMNLPSSGSVIHVVTPEVDGGDVLESAEISLEDKSLDAIYKELHALSTSLWIKFLKPKGIQ